MLGALVDTESSGDPNAVSPAGAQGVAQFMPATASDLGVDPLDPAQAIPAAGKYLRQQYDRFGGWTQALAAYNAGPGNVSRSLAQTGDIPTASQGYVSRVVDHMIANQGASDVGVDGGGEYQGGDSLRPARSAPPYRLAPTPQIRATLRRSPHNRPRAAQERLRRVWAPTAPRTARRPHSLLSRALRRILATRTSGARRTVRSAISGRQTLPRRREGPGRSKSTLAGPPTLALFRITFGFIPRWPDLRKPLRPMMKRRSFLRATSRPRWPTATRFRPAVPRSRSRPGELVLMVV